MTELDTQPWALDGCAILNLAAAMPLSQLSSKIGRPVLAARQAAVEALYLHDIVDGHPVKTPVDVRALKTVDLSLRELDNFVKLAAFLDDGEAATLALAHGRSYIAVTDDKAARKAAGLLNPPVPVIGTAGAVRYYAETTGTGISETRGWLTAIEQRAHFYPPRYDPDKSWWVNLGRPHQ